MKHWVAGAVFVAALGVRQAFSTHLTHEEDVYLLVLSLALPLLLLTFWPKR